MAYALLFNEFPYGAQVRDKDGRDVFLPRKFAKQKDIDGNFRTMKTSPQSSCNFMFFLVSPLVFGGGNVEIQSKKTNKPNTSIGGGCKQLIFQITHFPLPLWDEESNQ